MLKVPFIIGPTASGKTSLAVQLANDLNGVVLSADSRQVYKGLDIGTGKDLSEYQVEDKSIPHQLIDICNIERPYHVAQYQRDFIEAFNSITSLENLPIICGGTGMYLDAILRQLNDIQIPVNAELRIKLEPIQKETLHLDYKSTISTYNPTSDTSTKKRLIRAIEIALYKQSNSQPVLSWPDYQPIVFGLNPTTEIRRERISKRLFQRINEGMIEEVQHLLDQGTSADRLIFLGLEYKWITLHCTGQLSYSEMTKKLETEIHRFAKRQMTFFRSMEKKGILIHWLGSSQEENIAVIKSEINRN